MFMHADQANEKEISSEDFTTVNTFLQENIYIYITKEGKIRDKIDKIHIYVRCTNNMRKLWIPTCKMSSEIEVKWLRDVNWLIYF